MGAMPSEPVDAALAARQLLGDGFVHLSGGCESRERAWKAARDVFAAAAADDAIGAQMPALEVVGEFRLPPPGARRRAFQALHIDFGLPVSFCRPVDVSRFTALYIDQRRASAHAVTRLVALGALFAQRVWPDIETLMDRLSRCGEASNDVEGILGRLVEAADDSRSLPSSGLPGFLCGMEFASRDEERELLARHGLDLDPAERRVRLAPGHLLVFDNLAIAHGRDGVRDYEELDQLCVGYRELQPRLQKELMARMLNTFHVNGPPSLSAHA